MTSKHILKDLQKDPPTLYNTVCAEAIKEVLWAQLTIKVYLIIALKNAKDIADVNHMDYLISPVGAKDETIDFTFELCGKIVPGVRTNIFGLFSVLFHFFIIS